MTESTPFTDFLVSLAEPDTLERYALDPITMIRDSRLTEAQENALLSGNRGAIRMQAVLELEQAGLSPVVTDKIPAGALAMDPITINTNNFNINDTHIHTFDTTTYNTTHDNTTTTHTSSDWRAEVLQRIEDAISYFAGFVPSEQGVLDVVGSGIKPLSDLTAGARSQIERADRVLYCVADPATEREIHRLNPRSTSLYGLYGNDKPRIDTYREMVDAMLTEVRAGHRVCAVFYGHPGVFAWAPHVAVATARAEGHRAQMHPAVSAQDALVADLGIDPSTCGMQTMDATELLVHARQLDTYAHVLIWQAECVGDDGFNFGGYSRRNFPVLVERLAASYPTDHELVVYDASTVHALPPRIVRTTIGQVQDTDLTGISTLYLPPIGTPPLDTDMLARLGLEA